MWREHFFDGNVSSSELRSFSLGSFHGSLQNLCGINEFQLIDGWKHVGICKVRLFIDFFSFIIFYFGVHSSLWLIINPFSYKQLILVMIIVTALSFSHVINPVSFEVISISLGENTIAVPLAFMPLSFIYVLIGIYHSAFSLRLSIHPVTIISVSIFIEESSSAMLSIFKPITSVFSSQLACLISPVSTLAMSSISFPHALVLITILVKLNAKTIFAIIFPVSNVARSLLPFFTLNRTILLSLLFLHNKSL